MIWFDDDELMLLMQQIWGSMLNLPLQPVEEERTASMPAPHHQAGAISACVQMTGAWTGAVRLDCSEGLARRTAAAFVQLPAEDIARDEVLDAVCEVTNMIAGSVKPLVPKPCQISLPSVVDGSDYALNVRRAQVLLRSKFENCGDQLEVSLIEALLQ